MLLHLLMHHPDSLNKRCVDSWMSSELSAWLDEFLVVSWSGNDVDAQVTKINKNKIINE